MLKKKKGKKRNGIEGLRWNVLSARVDEISGAGKNVQLRLGGGWWVGGMKHWHVAELQAGGAWSCVELHTIAAAAAGGGRREREEGSGSWGLDSEPRGQQLASCQHPNTKGMREHDLTARPSYTREERRWLHYPSSSLPDAS